MKTLAFLIIAGGMALAPLSARAEDIGGSVILHVSETPVELVEGRLSRNEVIAIHELSTERGAVLLENAARGMASSRAGAVLTTINAGPRTRLYCDLNARRALSGDFATCYEDQDGDGRLETRYLASTRTTAPSTFLIIAAPDTITPASYREAEAQELPIARFGFRTCAAGRRPTFKLVVAMGDGEWSTGGRCETAERIQQTTAVQIEVQAADDGATYRVTRVLEPGSDVIFLPTF